MSYIASRDRKSGMAVAQKTEWLYRELLKEILLKHPFAHILSDGSEQVASRQVEYLPFKRAKDQRYMVVFYLWLNVTRTVGVSLLTRLRFG